MMLAYSSSAFRTVLPSLSDWKRPLRIIAIAAVALRLLYIAIAHPPLEAAGDAPGYDRIARKVLDGRGFVLYAQPSAQRTPGYPLFVAAIYALGGGHTTVLVVQAFLDGGSLLLLGPIGTCLGVAPAGIVAAAALAAVFPPLVQQPAFLMSESLFQLLLLAALAVTLQVKGIRTALLAGALWGLTVLVRPAPAFFVPIIGVLVAARRHGRNWTAGVALVAAFAVTIAPWIIRNQRVIGAPVFSTFGWQDVYVYNSVLDTPDWTGSPAGFGSALDDLTKRAGWGRNTFRERSDLQMDSLCRAEALRLIKAHPDRFLALSLIKVARFWGNIGYGSPPSLKSWLVTFFMGALMLMFIVQFFRRRAWQIWGIAALTLFLIYNTALHAVSIAYFRHNLPTLPIFFLLAAWAISRNDAGGAMNDEYG